MQTLALIACFLALPVGIWIGWRARGRRTETSLPSFITDQP